MLGVLPSVPAPGKAAMMPRSVFFQPQEIAVEGNDDLGAVELISRNKRCAEGYRGPIMLTRLADRVVKVPAGLGQDGPEMIAQQVQGGAGKIFGEDSQSLAFTLANRGVVLGGKGIIVLPGGRPTLLEDGTGPIGVVEFQHGCLSQYSGGAATVGMPRVSLDLGGPPFVSLHQHREPGVAERDGRRVEIGQTGYDLEEGGLGEGRALSSGRRQPANPARPSEAAINWRNCRRSTTPRAAPSSTRETVARPSRETGGCPQADRGFASTPCRTGAGTGPIIGLFSSFIDDILCTAPGHESWTRPSNKGRDHLGFSPPRDAS